MPKTRRGRKKKSPSKAGGTQDNGPYVSYRAPKALYSQAEIEQLFNSVGHRVTVIDKNGRPRCTILQVEVFEARFGSPPPKLFNGEGYVSPAGFKRAHCHVWDDLLAQAKVKLTDKTMLLTEVFRLLGKPQR